MGCDCDMFTTSQVGKLSLRVALSLSALIVEPCRYLDLKTAQTHLDRLSRKVVP
jgi:hypothetical protein